MRHAVALDTDIGTDVDDALCLALAMASPEVELVAVTTVSGDTELRGRIARRLLELGGRADVPVYAGERAPLGPGGFFRHGGEGTGILEPGRAPELETEPAPAALARLLRARDDLEIVAVGPLTNLAVLLRDEPGLARRIRRLTVMGGHLREIRYGEAVLPFGVDYNLCSDATASEVVLAAGVPTRLVTGDVTLRTWLRPSDLERIEAAGTPLHGALSRAVRHWSPIQRQIFSGLGARIGEENVAFLHDPLALACVHDESFCGFEDLSIAVGPRDGVFRTVEAPDDPGARPMRCATAVDAERFRRHFVERVAAYAPR